MFAYRGSTAMITGASKGLGAAFAKELQAAARTLFWSPARSMRCKTSPTPLALRLFQGRSGRPRSARGHLASRSHASGRALSRALVRSVKLSPTTRLNEPLQRPARMSSFGANSVDASERLAARRSMERRLSGFHNGAAPAHTEGLRVSAVRWRQARPVRSATGPPTDAGKLARRPWEDYPVRGSVAP
jgi:hypothetical protein